MADWEDAPDQWEDAPEVAAPPGEWEDAPERKPRVSYKMLMDSPVETNWLEELANYEPGYEYGALLPFRKMKGGPAEFAAPEIVKQAAAALLAPGRAQQGLIDFSSPEAVQQAINLGGGLQLGAATRNLLRKDLQVPPSDLKSPEVPKPTPEVTTPPQAVVETANPMPAVFKQRREPVAPIQAGTPLAPLTPEQALVPGPAAARAEPINLSQFDDEAGVGKLLETTIGSFTPEQIAYAKRGKIDFGTAQQLADATGYDAKFFLGNKPGTVYNAETIQRFGNIVSQSSKELIGLAKAASDPAASKQALLDFKKAQLVHSALVNRFVGASSESGRTLNQLKAAKGKMDEAKYLQKAIEGFGGEDNLVQMAKVLASAENDQQARKLLAQGEEFKWSDVFLETWKAGLLTGVKTQFKNLASNSYTNITSIPERVAAATVGSVRSAITGSKDKVTFREAGAMIEGYKDTPNAMSNFVQAMKNEDYLMEGGGKGDVYRKAITAENFRAGGMKIAPGSKMESFLDNTGKAIRIPFRVLNATDVGFKTVAASQQLRALAYRDAAKQNLKGPELETFIQQRLDNPSPKEMEAAMDWAHYMTFTNDLGKFGKAFQQLNRSHPAMQLVTPFTSTPINLAKYFVERTPLQLLSRTTRQKIKAGGAESDMALGKMITGAGIMYGISELVEDNVVSMPYSVDPGMMSMEYQAGYRPFAVKTETGYIPIDSVDPLGSMVALTAGLKALDKFYTEESPNVPKLQQNQKLYAYAADTFSNVFIDKTYAQGLSNLIEGFSSGKGAQGVVEGFAKSMIPTIARDINTEIDPTTYRPLSDKEGFLANSLEKTTQAAKAANPLASKEGLYPALDLWGQPRVRSSASMWNPWKESPLTEDKATMMRLKYGIGVPAPESETTKLGLDLTEADQYLWKQMQGQMARKLMDNKIMNAPLFTQGEGKEVDLARRAVLEEANTQASRYATTYIAVQKALKDKEKIEGEMMKKLFPPTKRKDIVE